MLFSSVQQGFKLFKKISYVQFWTLFERIKIVFQRQVLGLGTLLYLNLEVL